MGDIKKYLSRCCLPSREKHNSRIFIDLAENIHIHHREYRTVFSINEFLEYSDIVNKGREELLMYLENNQNYEEMKYPTTIMISGGREQQLKFIANSPSPICSQYYNNDFAVELQEEYVADEIHIHYRDFRLVFNRENFKIVAEQIKNAYEKLVKFELENQYIKQKHPDTEVLTFNQTQKETVNSINGAKILNINKIKSYWYSNILEEFKPDNSFIKKIINAYYKNYYVTPILVSTEKNGDHYIIDGHHRYFAQLKLGAKRISCIVANITFKESEPLRAAEASLKKFDNSNNYKYNFSNYFKSYMVYKLNRFFYKNFCSLMSTMNKRAQLKRIIKKILFNKKKILNFIEKRH